MFIPSIDADRVAVTSFAKYRELPKTGKPIHAAEWTVLSCILQHQSDGDQLHVVALGTGTKCLSADALTMLGDRLNDSHAEVIARRAFMRYLIEQMHGAVFKSPDVADVGKSKKSAVFEYDSVERIFRLNDGITFHFFTTHPPCGDGSIFKFGSQLQAEPATKRAKLDESDDHQMDDFGDVVVKVDGFTGGKLVDPQVDELDLMAQNIGAVRTKPGKGTRTLSVSCSDKLSRWSIAGCQGGLLMSVLARPIYLRTITICGPCDVDAIERAIWKRWEGRDQVLSETFKLHIPKVFKTSSCTVFEHGRAKDLQPAPSSIAWCLVVDR